MINEQLAGFVRSQLKLGINKEEIRRKLLSNGWTNKDIGEVFDKVDPLYSSKIKKKNNRGLKIIAVVLVIVALSLASFIFYKGVIMSNINLKNSETQEEKQSVSEMKDAKGFDEKEEIASCELFPDQLNSCTPYKCQFAHPFTQENMNREILGIVDNLCHYIEQVPSNREMKCFYTEEDRKIVAQYYQMMSKAESIEVSVNLGGEGDSETVTVVDGEEIEDLASEIILRSCVF